MINYLRFVGNNWRSKVYDILFVIFIFSISTFQRISAAVLVLLVVVAPFTAVRKEFWRGVQASWDLLAYFAVLSIGLLYTTDLLQGIKVLETSLSLLAVSFVVGFFSKHIDLESGIFYPFVAGLWVSGLICLFNAFRSYCTGEGVEVFFFEHFTSAIDAQPTYFAYYLIFGITAGLYILHFENPKSRVARWGPPWSWHRGIRRRPFPRPSRRFIAGSPPVTSRPAFAPTILVRPFRRRATAR